MTPINHYEGDRPKDFYNDGLFIRFAMTIDEVPPHIRFCLMVDEIPSGMVMCFTQIGEFMAKHNVPVAFVKHEDTMREYCFKELRRTLIDTIGTVTLIRLLNNSKS